MNSQPGLVVPIRIEALLISAADLNRPIFLPASADFSNLPAQGSSKNEVYLSQSALRQPFTGAGPLREGIHLHWFLPKALRQGNTDEQGKMSFPNVPDRWLVVRSLVNSNDGSVALRSWVVESNYLNVSNAYSNTTVPWTPDAESPNTWRYLGRIYDYDDWLENGNKGKYYSPLNAMGYGIPDFASCYANCTNVFTFFDDSLNQGIANDSQLSYSVTGWYNSSDDDPLSAQSISGKANNFNWLFNDIPDGESPSYTLLQGCINDIPWDPSLPGGYFPDAKDPAAVDVALGNTSAEALSALVAASASGLGNPNKAGGSFSVEQLLNAAQIGALQTLGSPGGLEAFEQSLFNLQFTPAGGGILWDIQPRQGKQAVAVGEEICKELQQLNQQQSDNDELGFKISNLQRQLYSDWNKFMLIQHFSPQNVPDINVVYAYLNTQINLIGQLQVQYRSGLSLTERQSSTIIMMLPSAMELVNIPAPRYYQPNDPVLIMAGPDIPSNPPDYAATANCVLTNKLVLSIVFPPGLVKDSAGCVFDASYLPAFGNTSSLPGAILSSWQSTQLQNSEWLRVLVELLGTRGVPKNPASIDPEATYMLLSEALHQWQKGEAPSSGIVFNGLLPQANILYQNWEIPWYPVSISWGFDFTGLVPTDTSKGESYPPDAVISLLHFNQQDFDYNYPDASQFLGARQQYQGMNLLSSGASTDLRTQLSEYLKYNKDQELQRILDGLKNTNSLSQSLGGFHDTLSMLTPSMQLPVGDPAAISRAYSIFSNSSIPPVVNEMNQQTPQLNFVYNPFRAGRSVLRQLQITDSFGRFKNVNLNNLIVSETIPSVSIGTDQPPLLYLPPRVSQFMQLSFRYLSAVDSHAEMTGNIEDSPVCGWIVPNHLDESLLFYDGAGTPVGTMYNAADNSKIYWMDAPGGTSAGKDIQKAFAHSNQVLAQFALSTFANGPLYLKNLIRTFDRTATYVVADNGQSSASTSVLIGTPMALVQTGLSLDFQGMPMPAQDYASLANDIAAQNPLKRSTYGLTEIEFPILMGSLTELNDGLYGFFLSKPGAGQYDFTTFYSEAATAGMSNIVAPTSSTFTLSADGSGFKRIAMLVDPRCEVHAYSGILPVKAISIPESFYASIVANLCFTFLTAPLIWTGTEATLPVPGEGDGEWTWISLQNNTWQNMPISPVDQSATLQQASSIQEGWLRLGKNNNP